MINYVKLGEPCRINLTPRTLKMGHAKRRKWVTLALETGHGSALTISSFVISWQHLHVNCRID